MIRYLLCLCGLGIVTSPAFAHKLLVKVDATDRAVNVVATYEDGEPIPAGAKVAILDRNGTELVAGVTDETGECRLARPAPGIYAFTVDDRHGHFEKVILEIREGESGTIEPSRRNRWIAGAVGLTLIVFGTIAATKWKKKSPLSPSP